MEDEQQKELNQELKCLACGHTGKTDWTPWNPTPTRGIVSSSILGSLFGPLGVLASIAIPDKKQKRICAKCGSKKLKEIETN